MSTTIGTIQIPTDEDGFVLLQCPLCGTFFKLSAKEMESDEVIEIFCPSCGLKSRSYLTQDVIKTALAKATNYMLDAVHEGFKKLERNFNNQYVEFSAGPKPKHEIEGKVHLGIDALDIEKYPCCEREVKIDSILLLCGSYCPYCGVRYDGNK